MKQKSLSLYKYPQILNVRTADTEAAAIVGPSFDEVGIGSGSIVVGDVVVELMLASEHFFNITHKEFGL